MCDFLSLYMFWELKKYLFPFKKRICEKIDFKYMNIFSSEKEDISYKVEKQKLLNDIIDYHYFQKICKTKEGNNM